ncbi:hypothetical protein PFLA_a0502 [Pseudoalteromonas flavipulchra NCIMB 2033 = ATCC BAA-314]|nr:hypothetical protein [Pseudoalteromonas flavipulchra NCIMB 2033 = ATCC BAA-314]
MTQSVYEAWYWKDGSFGGCSNAPNNNVTMHALENPSDEDFQCPPEGYPKYIKTVMMEGTMFCGKEKEPVDPKDNQCPEPSPSDATIFDVSGQGQVCFDNPNGTQCRIKTQPDGTYKLPTQYGSQETSVCRPNNDDPATPPDEPDPIDPTQPDKPTDPDDPNTSDPSNPSDPDTTDGDNSDKSDPIEAMNQINDNLTTLIDNESKQGEVRNKRIENTNDLLTQIRDLTQVQNEINRNTNDILSPLAENSAKSIEALNKSNELQHDEIEATFLTMEAIDDQTQILDTSIKGLGTQLTTIGEGIQTLVDQGGEPCTGPDCPTTPCTGPDCPTTPCTGPDCEPEPEPEPECEGFDCKKVTQERKQGGLTELFKDDAVEEVKGQIEEQLEENRTQIEQIQSELNGILDISPSIGGSYEDRKINLYGETIDISVARFSSFYQMLSAPLMLIAAISALFILLRERHD